MQKDIKNLLIENFANFIDKLNGQGKSKIQSIRHDAYRKLINLQIPTQKNEEWRYANLNFLYQYDFDFEFNHPDYNLEFKDIEDFIIPEINENLLVFVNGIYSEKLSKFKYQRDEIILENLASAEKRNAPNLIANFSNLSNYNEDFFTAANTAYARDGVYINIPAGVYVEEPIHIMFITDSRYGPVISNPRNLFIVGKCSQVKIIETYHTIGDKPAFTNMVTELFANFASNIDFYKIQNDKGNSFYIGSTNVEQAKNSSVNMTTISLNGNFVRNNIKTILDGENSELNLYGLYFLKDKNYVDNHTEIIHSVPNCQSNEYYKGILADQSKAVFKGRIVVKPNAQKTNAYQSNKNILLSDDAKIHTLPQLEIYADDVKCSHGATTGYFDKEAIHYMKARGISDDMAKSLLMNAFASEIIEKIRIFGLRDNIKRLVSERLVVDDIYFCDVLDDLFRK